MEKTDVTQLVLKAKQEMTALEHSPRTVDNQSVAWAFLKTALEARV